MDRKTQKIALAAVVVMTVGAAAYFAAGRKPLPAVPPAPPPAEQPAVTAPAPPPAGPLIYRNAWYGFELTLPDSWKGYTVLTGSWEGATAGPGGETAAEQGPLISIRHPQWTKRVPRQDIPIMVFTIGQWQDLQKDKFHIGAAPIGPSELGRNSRNVIALPARYNFAFPAGYEEVDQIIQGHALRVIEPSP